MNKTVEETSVFPDAFRDLQPYAEWALALETARNRKRLASTMSDMQRFYDAMVPRMDEIITYLNGFDLAALSEQQRNLLYLSFALAEVSFAIEVYGQATFPNSFQEFGDAERFITVHDTEHMKAL